MIPSGKAIPVLVAGTAFLYRLAIPVQAVEIFSNFGTPDDTFDGGHAAIVGSTFYNGAPFTPSGGDFFLTSFEAPLQGSGADGTLTVALYASTGGGAPVPTGGPLETTSVAVTTAGFLFGPAPPPIETAVFAGTTVLQEGVPYFMVLSEGTTQGRWYLNDQSQMGVARTEDGGSTWNYLNLGTPAFRVNGIVPEASTYLLFGLGALGLMVWRKRKVR